MLKYSIRLTNDSFKQEEIVWGEKYLAPDLSFVTGVTSQNYHLEKQDKIAVSNTISHTPNSILNIETENVTRQGYVIVLDKEYIVDSIGNVKCVNLNGKYYYAYAPDYIFTIDHWLQAETSIRVKENTVSAQTNQNHDPIHLDTVYWIEDGFVTIDGERYIYDS